MRLEHTGVDDGDHHSTPIRDVPPAVRFGDVKSPQIGEGLAERAAGGEERIDGRERKVNGRVGLRVLDVGIASERRGSGGRIGTGCQLQHEDVRQIGRRSGEPCPPRALGVAVAHSLLRRPIGRRTVSAVVVEEQRRRSLDTEAPMEVIQGVVARDRRERNVVGEEAVRALRDGGAILDDQAARLGRQWVGHLSQWGPRAGDDQRDRHDCGGGTQQSAHGVIPSSRQDRCAGTDQW